MIVSDNVRLEDDVFAPIFGFKSATELLADESVAVALAVLLAVILVLISVFTVVVWLLGLRRRENLNEEKFSQLNPDVLKQKLKEGEMSFKL